MYFARKLRSLIGALATISFVVLANVAHAGVEQLVLQPALNVTIYKGQFHEDSYSCWPFTCFFTNGIPGPLTPPLGQVAVGFDYFDDPGTKPCNCQQWAVYAYRGQIFFKVADLPKNFLTAHLVLGPIVSNQHGNSLSNPITGVFENANGAKMGFDDSSAWFAAGGTPGLAPALLTQFDVIAGGVTALRQFSVLPSGMMQNPVFSSFPVPANPGLNTEPVAKEGFFYSIDVSQTVRNWVGTNTPLRGFNLVGPDESLSHASTTALTVQYAATLVFEILGP